MVIKNSTRRQWYACLSCSLIYATYGVGYSWTTPLLVTFVSPDSPVPMTPTMLSWVISSLQLGVLTMSIPSGKVADRFGRKLVLFSSGPFCLLSLAIIVLTRSVIYIIIAHVIHGFITGIVLTAGPTYIAEISEPRIRGTLGGFCQCGWQLGTLFSLIAGSYLDYNTYAYACAVVPIVSMISLYFIPESPYYLLMHKKEEEARKALTWVQHSQQIDEELQSIKEAVNKDMELKKSNWKDLIATKQDRKALLLVQLVCMVSYFSGALTIQFYIVEIFHNNIQSNIGSNELAIIFGLISALIIAVGAFLSDKLGRRFLIIFSTVGLTLLNLIIAVIYFLDEKTSVDVTDYKWITFISLICSVGIYNLGIDPLLRIVQSEYFPTHTRSIGAGVTHTFGAVVVFLSVMQYQAFKDYFGSYSNFVEYFIASFIGAILMMLLIPETAGKTLREVQDDCMKIN